jgi:sigma-B regulation protein RsbU (phosphoserine phosphatase)
MSGIAVQPRILIVDDQADVLDALRLLLNQEGFVTETVTSPLLVLAPLERGDVDLLLMDLNYTRDTTSGREGLDLLARIQAVDREVPIVAMTGWSTVELAVEAMRRGVRHFVQKPWDNDALLAIVRREIADGRLRRRQTREEQRELQEAQIIQRSLLPARLPRLEGWELAGRWQPAEGVAGDGFDALLLGASASSLALSIADVVGKGVPAALLMSSLQATVRAFAGEEAGPADLCARLNRVFAGNIPDDKFITFFYGLLDAASGRFAYCNAGHNAPVLVRADGRLERLTTGGMVLGVDRDAAYAGASVQLDRGDRLVLFTDGLTEAWSRDDEEFGEERLLALLVEHRAATATDLQARVFDAVGLFSSENHWTDDRTMVVLARDR